MGDLLQPLLGWIVLHPVWAGVTVFLVSLVESLALVGVVVPGVVVLFGVGTLIGNGTLDFWTTCLWAVAGAIVGDNLSYWLGHHYEDRLAHSRWFSLHPSLLAKGIDFFHRHGGMSIAFGRFFGPLRAVMPLVAGLLRMEPSHFLVANVLSALVWAPAYLLPGMVFGASLEQAGEVSLRLAVVILALGATYFGLFKGMRPLISRPLYRYTLATLILGAPLLLLLLHLHREVLPNEREPAGFRPLSLTASPAELGWKHLPPRRFADLIKFFSPSTGLDELPATFLSPGRSIWVKVLDTQNRLLLVLDDAAQGWVSTEQVRDMGLLRLLIDTPAERLATPSPMERYNPEKTNTASRPQ